MQSDALAADAAANFGKSQQLTLPPPRPVRQARGPFIAIPPQPRMHTLAADSIPSATSVTRTGTTSTTAQYLCSAMLSSPSMSRSVKHQAKPMYKEPHAEWVRRYLTQHQPTCPFTGAVVAMPPGGPTRTARTGRAPSRAPLMPGLKRPHPADRDFWRTEGLAFLDCWQIADDEPRVKVAPSSDRPWPVPRCAGRRR